MVLKWISIVIFFFEHSYLEIAESKYDIQIDFDIQFDVPNHNHNVSSQQKKSHSSVHQKLVSRNGIDPRYKAHKTKSRSLTGHNNGNNAVHAGPAGPIGSIGFPSTWSINIGYPYDPFDVPSGGHRLDLMDMHCKDKSGRCMTISVNSCRMPILAEVCKRSCGLCNGGQLQVLPPFPFHLQECLVNDKCDLMGECENKEKETRKCWSQDKRKYCTETRFLGGNQPGISGYDSLEAAVNACNTLKSCKCIGYHGWHWYRGPGGNLLPSTRLSVLGIWIET